MTADQTATERPRLCEYCGREKSILPDHLAIISCVANLQEDKESLAAELAEAEAHAETMRSIVAALPDTQTVAALRKKLAEAELQTACERDRADMLKKVNTEIEKHYENKIARLTEQFDRYFTRAEADLKEAVALLAETVPLCKIAMWLDTAGRIEKLLARISAEDERRGDDKG